jgi:hypothetical protein
MQDRTGTGDRSGSRPRLGLDLTLGLRNHRCVAVSLSIFMHSAPKLLLDIPYEAMSQPSSSRLISTPSQRDRNPIYAMIRSAVRASAAALQG